MSFPRSFQLHGLIGLLTATLIGCGPKTDTATPEPEAAKPEAPADEAKEPAEDAKEAEDDAKEAEDAKADAKAEEAKADAKPAAKGGDVLAVLADNPKTKTFSELVLLTDFGKGMHSSDGAGYTVLAPTDEAFAKLPKGTIDRWKKKPAELEAVIRLHIVLGTNDVAKLANFRTAPTAAGKDVEVKTQDNDMTVGGARVLDTDIAASNGVIHLLDKVLKK